MDTQQHRHCLHIAHDERYRLFDFAAKLSAKEQQELAASIKLLKRLVED